MDRTHIINEWDALGGTEQRNMVRRAVYRQAYRYYGGADALKRGGWTAEDHVSGAYIAVLERLNSDTPREDDTLKTFISRVTNNYLSRELYHVKRSVDTGADTLEDWFGGRSDYEDALIVGADLKAFIDRQDERNKRIIWMLYQGFTERQISAAFAEEGIKISNVAVHKRIVKMRAGLAA